MSRPAFVTAEPPAIAAALLEAGQPPYRARQAADWFWRKPVESFRAMRTLPAAAIGVLEQGFLFSSLEVHRMRDADEGLTRKYLFRLQDGRMVETVVMHYPGGAGKRARTTICISSQVGCPIGCSFCATGQSGFDRNLTEAEIVDQFLLARRRLQGEALTNVVFMGMGEPLNNYPAVTAAIRRWARRETLNFSPRRVTVSTIGLVPLIERLAGEGLPVNLAISLHAPDDQLRSQMIPVNRKYGVAALVAAARAYSERTGRRVSYEYVLLQGVNDSPEQAARLAALVRHPRSHVNLIPMNPIAGSPLLPPSQPASRRFQAILQQAGVSTTIRLTRGLDIDAACGQLRARELAAAPA